MKPKFTVTPPDAPALTPEQLRQQASDMLKRAEQLERSGETKDTLKKAMVPALRDLMQAKHRTQKAVDELVDSVADLEGRVTQVERIVGEVLS
jgi:polyhydroxyalkanoate synthesis regulator phasin